MCRRPRLQPSGFYAWLKPPLSRQALEDRRQTELIRQAWTDSGKVYGDPPPGWALRRDVPSGPRHTTTFSIRARASARILLHVWPGWWAARPRSAIGADWAIVAASFQSSWTTPWIESPTWRLWTGQGRPPSPSSGHWKVSPTWPLAIAPEPMTHDCSIIDLYSRHVVGCPHVEKRGLSPAPSPRRFPMSGQCSPSSDPALRRRRSKPGQTELDTAQRERRCGSGNISTRE